MNTKKQKNKKVTQQHNLNNPQKEDIITSDSITDSQISHIDCDTKSESVQVKTDDVIKQVDEQQESEVIAPKKPKRKKGKKKEKANEFENEKDTSSKPITVENVAIIDNENVQTDLPEVIPLRKKKIKKKGCVPGETVPLLEQKLDNIQFEGEIKSEYKFDNLNKNLPKIETIEDVKIAKKKNKKKKNRTDSEKSDKSVEKCTPAFQKLLDVDDDNNNNFDIPQVGTEIKCEEFSQQFEESNPVIELETPIQETLKSENLQCFEGNDDNKNKTENKQSTKKSSLFEDKSTEFQKQSIEETTKVVLVSDEATTVSVQNREYCSLEEDSLKCKAKIAKPVDKKRKERQESQAKSSIEHASLHEIEIQQPSVKQINKKNVVETVQEEEIEADLKTAKNKDELKGSEYPVVTSMDNSHNIENKEIQKPSKVSDESKTAFDVTEQTLLQEYIQKENVASTQNVVKDELIFETLVPSDFASKSSEGKLNEILNTITEATENKENKEFIKTESKQILENKDKTRKKGKKTPNILINPEKTTVTTEICKERESINLSEIYDKSSVLTPNDDVEIRSVKADESEGSTCDVTPFILYPRSTSEHIRDDNNNTVIKEVFEDTLNISLLSHNIPLIQGSGETPTETPEMVSSGIKLVEIENISTKLEEKTDIKSKIMEVNKDMEELRSSIEKSLAELNALEKKEEFSEKKLKEKHEIQINNKNLLDTNNIITQSITSDGITLIASDSQYEHTIDEVIDSLLSDKISQPVTSTIVQVDDTIHDIDQLNPEVVRHIDEINDETTPKNEQIKQDSTNKTPPVCPPRKDNKKGKKRKGRQEVIQTINTVQNLSSHISSQEEKKEEKPQQNSETHKQKSKQESSKHEDNKDETATQDDEQSNKNSIANDGTDYEPIENFEDALTSSADDINKTFEMIVNQITENSQQELAFHKPEINIIAPSEEAEKKDVKENPVTPPKNLLGHPNIPVRSNKTDYKKEKDKSPDTKQAKVKIKDNVEIEINKESKESQTEKEREEKQKKQLKDEEYFCQISNCDDYVYKYSFRRVFLQSACHVCRKELIRFRIPCKFCSLVFYCSLKHKDDDWPKHQALCFAVSTIVHVKGQKHIYADARNITGHNYRLLRMQAILASEKVLKRRLVPWEQEVLLYPRMCADVTCREWRQSKLKDCEGCGQISYCSANADHLPKTHQRWCKSYSLYQKLVIYQQTKGRLEPKLPSRVMKEHQMPEKINEVLASMFEEKIDLNDVQYAALTQIATAPLTVAFCHQIYRSKKKYATIEMNKMSSFTIHVVGAELQFEADVLNKWEIFFLHLRPDVKDLRVVLISPDLNPGKLPLDLLGRIRVCESCRQSKRRVVFNFQDNKTYQEYRNSDEFIYPDIVCAFNPGLHRSAVYNDKDPWPSTVNAVMKLKSPLIITSHTISELHRDLDRLKELSELKVMVEPRLNPFSSVRPDRNFISDDEVPLLFKNHCFMILLGL